MNCLRCRVAKALTKVTMGKVDYPVCHLCRAKLSHPAFQLAEMYRSHSEVDQRWRKA